MEKNTRARIGDAEGAEGCRPLRGEERRENERPLGKRSSRAILVFVPFTADHIAAGTAPSRFAEEYDYAMMRYETQNEKLIVTRWSI